MLSHPGVHLRQPAPAPPPAPAPAPAAVVPIFTCAGAKETKVDQLVFPHGGGFTQLTACPLREVCLWYAAHDLGGGVAINELPPAAVVAPEFRTRPFSCRRFQDHTSQRRAKRRRWQGPTLLGLLEAIAVLGCLDLTDLLLG